MKESDTNIIYQSNGINAKIKLIAQIISQLGFPIVACIAMFVVAWYGLGNVTKAIQANTLAVNEFSTRTIEFQKVVMRDHLLMIQALARSGSLKPEDARYIEQEIKDR